MGDSNKWIVCWALVTILGQGVIADIKIGVFVDSSVDIVGTGIREKIDGMKIGEAVPDPPISIVGTTSDWLPSSANPDDAADINIAVTVLGCQETTLGYNKIDGKALIVSVIDHTCYRPEPTRGFGFASLMSESDVVPLLMDLRRTEEMKWWENVFVIHDDSINLDILDGVVNVFMSNRVSPRPAAVTTFSVCINCAGDPNKVILRDVLKPVSKFQMNRYFVVIGKSDILAEAIRAGKDYDIMTIYKRWLLICMDPPSTNLWAIAKDTPRDANILLAYKEATDCKVTKGCELEALFDSLKAALPEVKSVTGVEATRNALIPILNEKLEASTTCGACAKYVLHSSVIADPKAEDKFERSGTWSPYGGLKQNYRFLFPVVSGDFRGRVLKIGIIENPPEAKKVTDTITGLKRFEGLVVKMIEELQIKLNFTPLYVEPMTPIFGLKENGHWSGLVGLIVDKQVELVANGMYMTNDRIEAVNFTHAIDEEPYLILTQKPDQDYTYLFLAPFTWDTWVLIVISVFMMGPMICLFEKFSKYYDYYGLRNDKGLFLLSNCAWYVYGAVVQQGGIHLPLAVSTRVLVGFWWIFVIVTVTSYSGNLVAVLTFPKIVNKITGVDDVLSYSRYLNWGAFEGEALIEFLNKDKNRELQALARNLKIYKREELNYTLSRVKRNRMVMLLSEREVLTIIYERLPAEGMCNYGYAARPVIREVTAMAVQRGWPFLQRLNEEIKILVESGLIVKWKRQYWPRENECTEYSKPQAGDTRKISIAHMWGSIIVLFFGFGSAFFSFFAEVLYIKCYVGQQATHLTDPTRHHGMKKENLAAFSHQQSSVNTIYPANSKVNLLYDADEDVPEQFTYTTPRDPGGAAGKNDSFSARNKKRRF